MPEYVTEWLAESRFPCGSVDWNKDKHTGEIYASVASLVGAWIEICMARMYARIRMSRFPCGSVDWNESERSVRGRSRVASLVGAWIEINKYFSIRFWLTSLPLWERGLKYEEEERMKKLFMSLPLWERGLKCKQTQRKIHWYYVASLVGAWIEISSISILNTIASRRFPCGSVDWNLNLMLDGI